MIITDMDTAGTFRDWETRRDDIMRAIGVDVYFLLDTRENSHIAAELRVIRPIGSAPFRFNIQDFHPSAIPFDL